MHWMLRACETHEPASCVMCSGSCERRRLIEEAALSIFNVASMRRRRRRDARDVSLRSTKISTSCNRAAAPLFVCFLHQGDRGEDEFVNDTYQTHGPPAPTRCSSSETIECSVDGGAASVGDAAAVDAAAEPLLDAGVTADSTTTLSLFGVVAVVVMIVCVLVS